MDNIDIIMQGPIWDYTEIYASNYILLPFVNKVIISTWEEERFIQETDVLKVIYNKKLTNPGKNNRNRQIYTTQEGIKLSDAPIIVKTRTDQFIGNCLYHMYEYFLKNYKIEEKYTDGSGPKGAIFTISLYKDFVFHPQDHLFWGWREDIIKLFSLPLDEELPPPDMMENPTDYGPRSGFEHTNVRPNTYIGMYYYSLFNHEIVHMVKNYREYIVDKAPKLDQAKKLDYLYKNKVFKSFPKLDIWWYKHNTVYPYHWGIPFTEYTADDI